MLTWGRCDSLRHRLGMGKPLGYGNVRILFDASLPLDLKTTEGRSLSLEDCLRLVDGFTTMMNQWCQQRFQTTWSDRPQFKAALALANPATLWRNAMHHPAEVKDFAAYKRRKVGETADRRPIYESHALLPVPGVGFPGPEPPNPDEPPLKPPPPPPPPPPLPSLTGQKRRVSFLRRQRFPKTAAESLVFRLKEGKDKFEARLDAITRTDLSGPLKEGASFELFVTGQADGRYLLSETEPSHPDSDSP